MNKNFKYSIIICSYTNGDKLFKAIHSIEHLNFPKENLEVIIVDNGSQNQYYHNILIKKIQQNIPSLNYKFILETRQGLVFARMSGILNASNEIIVYCDEDNYLDSNYLQITSRIFENSKVDMIGGKSINSNSITNQLLAIGKQYESNKDLDFTEVLWGAGLVFKKELICKILNNQWSFANNEKRGAGEDYELNYLYKINGKKLYYCDDLVLYHDIDPIRFNEDYLRELIRMNTNIMPMIIKYTAFYKFKYSNSKVRIYSAMKILVKYLFFKEINLEDKLLFKLTFLKKTMLHKEYNKINII